MHRTNPIFANSTSTKKKPVKRLAETGKSLVETTAFRPNGKLGGDFFMIYHKILKELNTNSGAICESPGSVPSRRFLKQPGQGRRCQAGLATLQLMDGVIVNLRNEANLRPKYAVCANQVERDDFGEMDGSADLIVSVDAMG